MPHMTEPIRLLLALRVGLLAMQRQRSHDWRCIAWWRVRFRVCGNDRRWIRKPERLADRVLYTFGRKCA